MTLQTNNSFYDEDELDMFGPPRSSPPIGYHHHRSRVPMISPKLRQREERKRILQLCATKLEGIKDSDTNLRRSVCINNTYSRLTDELRREKQSRYLSNLPTSENKSENFTNAESLNSTSTFKHESRKRSNKNVEKDLERLDREISAINASMPLIDPEITQGAEQLEKALSSRKRQRYEDENDQLVREALAQFYLPQERLISAIDDLPLDFKRPKVQNNNNNIDCDNESNIDINMEANNQSQKDFEVIMDALRLGTQPNTTTTDSCGQAAMMSESGNGMFHHIVASLET